MLSSQGNMCCSSSGCQMMKMIYMAGGLPPRVYVVRLAKLLARCSLANCEILWIGSKRLLASLGSLRFSAGKK